MKEKIYKYFLLSLILINIWTLYGFFDFFLETPGLFHGFGLGVFYFNTLSICIGIGSILILFRLVLYFLKKKNYLKTNFVYVLAGTFNLNICLITIVSLCLEILIFDIDFIPFLVLLIAITVIINFDIYKSNFKHKTIKPNV
jgi:hypothetical protein